MDAVKCSIIEFSRIGPGLANGLSETGKNDKSHSKSINCFGILLLIDVPAALPGFKIVRRRTYNDHQ